MYFIIKNIVIKWTYNLFSQILPIMIKDREINFDHYLNNFKSLSDHNDLNGLCQG